MALNVRNVVRTVFTADLSDIEKGAGGGTKAFDGFAATVVKTGAVLAALVTGSVALFLKSATDMASRAQEVQNLFDVSFGDMSRAAEEWSQRTEAAVGVNDTTLKEFAGTLFNMTSAMGLSRDEAFKLSTGFTELALDTSSFFNIPFEQAFDKIRAGLVGESEPLKQLGVLVTEGTVKQTAFAQAILATGRQLTETEKVQGRAIVIAQGLSNAQGDLIATSDSWANQTRLVGEAFVDLQETVGQFIVNSQLLGSIVATLTDNIRGLSTSVETNASQWEAVVSKGLFFFMRAGEQTVRVVGFLIEAMAFFADAWRILINVMTLGIFGLTSAGRAAEEMAQGLREVGKGMGASADDMGAGIDAMVSSSSRMAESGGQLTMIIANLEARNSSLVDQLRGELKQAIEQGGTIPTELYQRAVENLGGSQELAQDVIGRMISEIKNQGAAMVKTTGVVNNLTKAQKALVKAQEQHEKQVKSLADSLGKAGLLGEMELTRDALLEVLEAGDELRRSGFERLETQIALLIAEGKEVPPLFLAMRDEFLALNDVALTGSRRFGGFTEVLPSAQTELQKFREEMEKAKIFGDGGEKGIDRVTSSTDAFSAAVENLDHTFAAFGISANDTIGQLIAGFSTLAAQIPQLRAELFGSVDAEGNKIPRKLLGGAIGQGDFAGAAGGVATGIGAIASATSRGSTGARTGKGALAGLSAGAQVGGPIGAIVGAAAGAITGFLRGRSAQKALKNIENEVGVRVSEGLLKAIRDSGRPAQLMIADIFSEGFEAGTANVDDLAREVGDVFSFFERGEISKPEAITALENAIPLLLQNMDDLGDQGAMSVERIIGAAKEMGIEFEGLQELIQADFTDGTLAFMGLVGEKNIHRIQAAARELGIDFDFLLEKVQATFAPSTLEELGKQFDIGTEAARELAAELGLNVQTNLERMAASVGLTGKEFKELGAELEGSFGIAAEDLVEFLESTGLSARELAESLNVDVAGGAEDLAAETDLAGQRISFSADEAGRLADEIERAARAMGGIGGFSFDGGDTIPFEEFAHGGNRIFTRPTLALFGEDGPERVSFQPAGGGGGGSGPVTQNFNFQITVEGGILSTPEELQKKIEPGIERALKDSSTIRTEIRRLANE